MRELDPGHLYQLLVLDSSTAHERQLLRFVKRVGARYPGNVGPPYPGTNLQSVLRACHARVVYLDGQYPCSENALILEHLEACLWLLESRAASRHGRVYAHAGAFARTSLLCPTCGHTDCIHQ